MKARLFIIPMLLIAAACQQEKDTPDPVTKPEEGSETTGTYTLTIRATKDAETRALDLDGNSLTPYWKNTDKVKVYKGENSLGESENYLGTLDVTPGEGTNPSTATLSGEITVDGLSENDELTLLIPREVWSYTGQKGTLTGEGSIEDTYDYATATVTVAAVVGSAVTTTEANFQNQQSIYRFAFSGVTFAVEDFTITAAEGGLVQQMAWGEVAEESTGSITVKPTGTTAPGDSYFVALRNNNTTKADTYHFLITGTVNNNSGALLLGSKNIPAGALAAPGKFLSGTITVSQPDFAPAEGEISNAANVF